MQRWILGGSAVFLLIAAVVIRLWWPEAETAVAFCWRTGGIMAAAWLAYDDVQRLPNWLLLALPVLLIVLARWPKLLLLLIPALLLLAVVRRLLGPAEGNRRG